MNHISHPYGTSLEVKLCFQKKYEFEDDLIHLRIGPAVLYFSKLFEAAKVSILMYHKHKLSLQPFIYDSMLSRRLFHI